MNELYVIQCDDDPYCAPWARVICTSMEEAMKHARECDEFRYIEPFTLQNGVFKQSGKYFDENGNQVDYHGNPLNKEKFDEEINEALRLAGVKLNESNSTEEHVNVNDILVDYNGKEYVVTEIDDSYETDNYGQSAYYITVRHLENGKTVGGGLGFPSTAMHYVFHKKS